METAPIPEKSKKENLELEKEKALFKKKFDYFLSLSDDPGIPYSEQNKLLELSQKGDKEAANKYLESKKSKYRTNSLSGALMTAEIFLQSENSQKIPDIKLEELNREIQNIRQNIEIEKQTGFTKETVTKVVNIAEEVRHYLD